MTYTKRKAKSGCEGCAAEQDPHLCGELPLCSAGHNEGFSVIFVESDNDNETQADNR